MANPANRKNKAVETIKSFSRGSTRINADQKMRLKIILQIRVYLRKSAAKNLLSYLFKKYTTMIVKITLANATGSRNFQPKFMSWSNLNRGSVPRTQM